MLAALGLGLGPGIGLGIGLGFELGIGLGFERGIGPGFELGFVLGLEHTMPTGCSVAARPVAGPPYTPPAIDAGCGCASRRRQSQR